jgi:hypothetical protein
MKDVRCLLGRHAYTTQLREGQQPRHGEALVTCARCGKTARVVLRPNTQGDQDHREILDEW